MFIHRVNECEELYYGLNFLSNEYTLISFKILLPLYPILPKKYFSDYYDTLFYGWRVKNFKLVLRIRRWKNFESKTKKILFSFSTNIQSFGKQRFLCTREMIEDNKCLSIQ